MRRVTRRENPLDYGPQVRVEARTIQEVEMLDADGKPVLKRDGTPKTRDKSVTREVYYGPLSAVRRAFPDEAERGRRKQVGGGGGARPDKIFRLANP